MKKIKHFVVTKKIWSAIILIAILSISYYSYGKIFSTANETRYIVENASMRNVVTTISGTGQISATSQLDIKSKVSGDITYLNTSANGTQIKKDDIIAKIDDRDALIALESAQIAYDKVVQPTDQSTIIASKISLADAINNNSKVYTDAYSQIVSTYQSLPTIMSGMYDLFYSKSGFLYTENMRRYGQTALDYDSSAGVSFDMAKNSYDNILRNDYPSISKNSSTSSIESFVSETYNLVQTIQDSLKKTQEAIRFAQSQDNNISTTGSTDSANVIAWSNSISSSLTNLVTIKNNLSSTAQTVSQKTLELAKTEQGADALDIKSAQLSLLQKQYAYQDYTIRAPFDGLLARLSVKSTDTVSNGTVIGTIVSKQKIATITLNEVDVSKVRVGQNVTLSFDAIDGFTATGTVSTVDMVGTVSQGVVNYNVEITLGQDDDRIKSGMSVSASIEVQRKDSVLTVSNSAIKSQGNSNYVEVFSTPLVVAKGTGSVGTPSTDTPIKKKVEIGISDDSRTEILSGINLGDQVIVRTISGTTATTATAGGSLFGGTGTRTGTGGGNNTTRIPRTN